MSGPIARRCGIAVGVFVAIALFGACDETNDIVVSVDPNNKPPMIVTQGPDFPAGPIEVVGGSAPGLWVLVGDPNGLDDISAVFLDVQSIRLHGIIIRPADFIGECVTMVYTPNNTIDTSSLVPDPTEIGKLKSAPLIHDQGGIYRINPFVVPQLAQALPIFGWPSGCGIGLGGYLEWLLLLPPAAPVPTNVFLTYADEEFIGISVTVYDSSGASARTTFPNLRVVFTTSEEKTVAP
jgi:hypothetical protein